MILFFKSIQHLRKKSLKNVCDPTADRRSGIGLDDPMRISDLEPFLKIDPASLLLKLQNLKQLNYYFIIGLFLKCTPTKNKNNSPECNFSGKNHEAKIYKSGIIPPKELGNL